MADAGYRQTRGLTAVQEIEARQTLRDTRTLSMKFGDATRDPWNNAIIVLMTMVVVLIFPVFTELALFFAWCLYARGMKYGKKRIDFALRSPQYAKRLDWTDVDPGNGKALMGRGIYFLGNEIGTNRELWSTNDDVRTHFIWCGTTGSGKTFSLTSLCVNALITGSGFMYTDGKADVDLHIRLYAILRYFGREDDYLLLNFITGGKDIVGKQTSNVSNTINTFTVGSSSMISQNLISLLAAADGKGGDMWQDRAINFIEALARPLVYYRDNFNIPLNVDIYRQYFTMNKLIYLVYVMPEKLGVPPRDAIIITKQMKHFIENLAGFSAGNAVNLASRLKVDPNFIPSGEQEEKMYNQSPTTLDQLGYVTMQLVRSTGSLADVYAHIFGVINGEVDNYDIMVSRRCLLVGLPALEKSPPEIANLGKVYVSNVKATLASTLAPAMEGSTHEMAERRPTRCRAPFLACLDEFGSYAEGGQFSTLAAQARSLGLSAIFSSQDVNSMRKNSKEEADTIIANSSIKACMKLEDPGETFEVFQKAAGRAYVHNHQGYQGEANAAVIAYRDQFNVNVEMRDRIDPLDLKDQDQGEAHIIFKSRLLRVRVFAAILPTPKRVKINRFVPVPEPTEEMIQRHLNRAQSSSKAVMQVRQLMASKKTPPAGHKAWDLTKQFVPRDVVAPNRSSTEQEKVLYDALSLDAIIRRKPVKKVDKAPVGSNDNNQAKPNAPATPPKRDVANDEKPETNAGTQVKRKTPPKLTSALHGATILSDAHNDPEPDDFPPVAMLDSAIDPQSTQDQLASIEQSISPEEITRPEAVKRVTRVTKEIGKGVHYSRTIRRSDQKPDKIAQCISNLHANIHVIDDAAEKRRQKEESEAT